MTEWRSISYLTFMATTKLRLCLREVMWNKEVSQGELARRLGRTRQNVGLLLGRKAESLMLGTAVKIADALGVDPWDLVEVTRNGSPVTRQSRKKT